MDIEVGTVLLIRRGDSLPRVTVTVTGIRASVDGDTMKITVTIRDSEGNETKVGAFALAHWRAAAK